jgi:hypothetical protein
MTWTCEKMTRPAAAEELEITACRYDGTLRGRVTIWVIRHGDNPEARSTTLRLVPVATHVHDPGETHVH